MMDGTAGKPELFVGPDCKNLNGADDLAVDKDDNGSMIVAVNKLNKIVKVSMDKKITLESGGVLDFPASIKIDNNIVVQQVNNRNKDKENSIIIVFFILRTLVFSSLLNILYLMLLF
jgi:hypothetical protein